MTYLVKKTITVGSVAFAVIIVVIFLTLNTAYFDDVLAWITLIISIGVGIIITIIVDKRASDSHQEVIRSQADISDLLERLKQTDQMHKESLDKLNESRIKKEELAKDSILTSLCYVSSILLKLISSLNEKKLDGKHMQLIRNVLDHLESPLNIIEQSIPHTDNNFQNYKSDIQTFTKSSRKLIIASVSVSDNEVKDIFRLIKKTSEILEEIIKKNS